MLHIFAMKYANTQTLDFALFMAISASITAWSGPLRPDFSFDLFEYNRLYFLLTSALWNLKNVAGLKITATF